MRIFRRFQRLLAARREAAALREEMEFHRSRLEAEAREDGLDPRSARDLARRRMGNLTQAAEDARRVWLAAWVESVFQDLRYAARSLASQRSFTALALLALVLGIGLSTSLFTVFNAVALRPWPVREPGRVVTLFRQSFSGASGGFPVAEYRYLNEQAKTLSAVILMREERVSLDNQPDGPRSSAHFVSGNYFSVLGVNMALGRGLTPADDALGAPSAVAVLSYGTWRTRYGADPAILGRTLRIDDIPFTVAGVAAEEFTGTSPNRHDVWVPVSALVLARPGSEDARKFLNDPGYCCSMLAARLQPGVSRDTAAAELTVLDRRYHADSGEKPHSVGVYGTAFLSAPGGKAKAGPTLALLGAAVFAILLLACANVSNLLLARGAARKRELAIRLSIGAGRGRIIRQLLTEGSLLAGIAGALAFALAWFLPGFIFARATDNPPVFRLAPDGTVLAWALGVAALSTVLFALAPALRGTRVDVSEAMKENSGTGSPRLRMRGALLGVQVAISVMLLVCAGLLVRALAAARSAQPGFATGNLNIVSVDLPVNSYPRARAQSFYAEVLAAAPAPVGLALLPPLGNSRMMTAVRIPGQDASRPALVLMQLANAAFFESIGIPIVAGRNFEPADSSRRCLIINQTMARMYWPGGDALGTTVTDGDLRREIVGVAADAKLYSLGPTEPMIFEAFAGDQRAVLIVPGAPAAAQRITEIVQRLEPRAIVSSTTAADQLDRFLGAARTGAALAGALGLLALLLAAIGVYGVIAYSVEQRRREIGIRIALGAHPARVARFVLRANAAPVLCGLGAGFLLALVASAALRGSLFGVSRLDPLAYAGAMALLAAAGAAATLAPALRATRTSPRSALHAE